MKKEILMSDFIQELTSDFKNELVELLDYEIKINEKKIKGITLTEEEFIFDTYFVKPSTIIKTIMKRDKND